jgi:hypothetical protein
VSDPDNNLLEERAAQLMRYRLLLEDVTDPLAARLMGDIIKELETELENAAPSTKPRK